MIKTEFGIINDFDEKKNYMGYHPEQYNCVAIDDDLYLNDWWKDLLQIDTLNVYTVGVLQPQKALSRWGITIIPPKSLLAFYDIVVSDHRYSADKHLVELAKMIQLAYSQNKYMIHYGV